MKNCTTAVMRIASFLLSIGGLVAIIIIEKKQQVLFAIAYIALLYILLIANFVQSKGIHAFPSLLHSTRFRLTLWYAAILAFTLLIFGNIIYTVERQTLYSSLTDQSQISLLQLVDKYSSTHGSLSPQPTIDEQSGTVNREITLFITPQGRVRQSFGSIAPANTTSLIAFTQQWIHALAPTPHLDPANQLSLTANSKTTAYNINSIFLELPNTSNIYFHSLSYSYFFSTIVLFEQKKPVGFIIYGIPSDIPTQLKQLTYIIELSIPIVLFFSSIVGYWIADRSLRPLQKMAYTVQQISETDLQQRLNLKRHDEVGELAATFNHMLARLEAAFERQRQFTADVSHELRTPLAIIDIEATRTLSQEYLPEQYRQAITVILQEDRAMAHLVNDLLTLARVDAGQQKLTHERVDMSEVIIDSVERLAPLAQQTGITIQSSSSLPELIVEGDCLYLSQMITNIVENALKYSAGIGTYVEIDLVVKHELSSDRVRIDIQDNGPGIAQEHLPHLFERFYRVDLSRTHNHKAPLQPGLAPSKPTGTGLGLSIAYWIVQAHKGEIKVQSEQGRGTLFIIELPLHPSSSRRSASATG